MMGEEGPVLQGECISCGLCYRFCPGREMDFAALSRTHFGSPSHDSLLGYYRSLAVGRANSEQIREVAASGGVVTALLTHCLEEGRMKGALAVRMSKQRPWQCEASLLSTAREVKEAAQSKYSLVSLDALLGKARKQEGPFAVVGLPCHVHGLRRLQQLGSFRDRFPLVIGLFCGFNMRSAATEYLIGKLAFREEQVSRLEYRGGEWPGGFLVRGRNGRQRLLPKNHYGYANLMYVPRRCLACPDLTNELADISVGDMWLGEYTGGWSTVVARSRRGQDLLKEAMLRDVIRLEEITREQLLRSHAHLFAYKKEGYFVRQEWLRVPLDYSVQKPPMGKTRWLQQSLFLAFILTLNIGAIRGLVQRLPLALLCWLSSWGRKASSYRATSERGPKPST
jgi:coenzyme F420 hydrogenase subunit beta